MKRRNTLLTAGLLLGLNTFTVQASLFDRGGGLIYDDVLDVTWLQDANYAKTSGYDLDGLMDWQGANAWAEGLVYHDRVRDVDWSDWRLASNTPINGYSFNTNRSNDGSTDVSFNITSANSELAYMFHVNLGLKSRLSPTGDVQTDYGIFGNGTTVGQTNVEPVVNLQSAAYWLDTDYESDFTQAWFFAYSTGFQSRLYWSPSIRFNAWAVRDGDVAPVPVPGAVWLFGSGLLGLLNLKRPVCSASAFRLGRKTTKPNINSRTC